MKQGSDKWHCIGLSCCCLFSSFKAVYWVVSVCFGMKLKNKLSYIWHISGLLFWHWFMNNLSCNGLDICLLLWPWSTGWVAVYVVCFGIKAVNTVFGILLSICWLFWHKDINKLNCMDLNVCWIFCYWYISKLSCMMLKKYVLTLQLQENWAVKDILFVACFHIKLPVN